MGGPLLDRVKRRRFSANFVTSYILTYDELDLYFWSAVAALQFEGTESR